MDINMNTLLSLNAEEKKLIARFATLETCKETSKKLADQFIEDINTADFPQYVSTKHGLVELRFEATISKCVAMTTVQFSHKCTYESLKEFQTWYPFILRDAATTIALEGLGFDANRGATIDVTVTLIDKEQMHLISHMAAYI